MGNLSKLLIGNLLFLDNEVKITISDEVKEIVAEQVSSRVEYEKEIRKLEIRAKYKNELEKMEDKKFNRIYLKKI